MPTYQEQEIGDLIIQYFTDLFPMICSYFKMCLSDVKLEPLPTCCWTLHQQHGQQHQPPRNLQSSWAASKTSHLTALLPLHAKCPTMRQIAHLSGEGTPPVDRTGLSANNGTMTRWHQYLSRKNIHKFFYSIRNTNVHMTPTKDSK